MHKHTVKTQYKEICLICNNVGEPLYNNLKDQLFSAPGEWGLLVCPSCKLIWLSPYPIPEEMGKMYSTYYTHKNINRSLFDSLLERLRQHVFSSYGYTRQHKDVIPMGRFIPFFKDYAAYDLLKVRATWGKKLLDIGAGNGEFLYRMKKLGWSVEGTEFDPTAAKFAESNYDVKVHVGELLDIALPSSTYDVITLNHVIEHVYEPERFLQECKRLLAPGGRIVILTPNSQSLGHSLFKQHWRGLEIPRHLTIFSVDNFASMADRVGFIREKLTSTARISRYLFSTSVHIRQGRLNIGSGGNRGYWLALKSYGYQSIEEIVNAFTKKAGEEMFYIGRKE
jgi:2-polyprenyl-3-methyl-5-hydroxy-6-metoxy-1,4-benzoquinol methylase